MIRPVRLSAHEFPAKQSLKVRTALTAYNPAPAPGYLAVGITNSAPLPMLSGHRCMIDFCFV
jgi:hypothetical protein